MRGTLKAELMTQMVAGEVFIKFFKDLEKNY
jgi:hypothetical protein